MHTSIHKGQLRRIPLRTVTDRSLLAALAPLAFLTGFEELGVHYRLSTKPYEACLEPPNCGPGGQGYVDYSFDYSMVSFAGNSVTPPIQNITASGQNDSPPYASLMLYSGNLQPWGIDFNASAIALEKFLVRCAAQLLGTIVLVANVAKMVIEKPAFASAWKLARTFLQVPSNLISFEELGAFIAELGLVIGAANLLGILAAVAGAGVAGIAIYKCIAAGS